MIKQCTRKGLKRKLSRRSSAPSSRAHYRLVTYMAWWREPWRETRPVLPEPTWGTVDNPRYLPSYLLGYTIIDLAPEDMVQPTNRWWCLALIILQTPPASPPLTCHCSRCQAFVTANNIDTSDGVGPSPTGLHLLFGNLARDSDMWGWVRAQLHQRSRTVLLVPVDEAHRLWSDHRMTVRPDRQGPALPPVHIW